MDFPDALTRTANLLDRWLTRAGRACAWLALVLIAAIMIQILLRYVVGQGRVWLEELQWHLYAVGILIGLSYTTIFDGHVRVDLFFERFSARRRAWVELLGTVLLLWPMIYVVFIHSLPFLAESYTLGESSDAPAGLPYRWIVKGFIPLGFALLFLASLARVLRAINVILHRHHP
jgi:TRAP-type mannitol/chloroaromatic compound transport system permease small subunit